MFETDPERARAIGRPRVQNPYLGLTNYVSNLRRLGWTDADLADGGSDALIDALAVHGDAAAIAGGVTAHLDAGANHVAVQVLNPDPLPALRALAGQLQLTRIIGTIMAEPIWASTAGSRRPGGPGGIGAVALADLLGRWPTADGPLYRLLATRIARLADTGELPAGLRLPPERDLAAALSVSRNTVAAAYQVLRDEGMAESRQGAGTRIVPHRTTPAAVHRANGFFAGLLEDSVLDADLTLAAVDCAPQVAAALADPSAAGTESVTATSGYFPLGLARPAHRDRQPPDRTPRAARRPGRGDRHDRRPAGHGPAHPV